MPSSRVPCEYARIWRMQVWTAALAWPESRASKYGKFASLGRTVGFIIYMLSQCRMEVLCVIGIQCGVHVFWMRLLLLSPLVLSLPVAAPAIKGACLEFGGSPDSGSTLEPQETLDCLSAWRSTGCASPVRSCQDSWVDEEGLPQARASSTTLAGGFT